MLTCTRHALMLVPVLALVACSGADETPSGGGKGAASGGEGAPATTEGGTCVPPGTWVLSYALDASSDALCQELPDVISEEDGDGSPAKAECDASCTCEGAIAGYPTCGGKQTTRCDDGDSRTTTTLELTRTGATSYEGRAVIERVLPQVQLRCGYAIRFARK